MGLQDPGPGVFLAREAEESRSLKDYERDRMGSQEIHVCDAASNARISCPKKVGGRVYWKLEASSDHRDRNVSSLLGR